jgi:hypothetical protein
MSKLGALMQWHACRILERIVNWMRNTDAAIATTRIDRETGSNLHRPNRKRRWCRVW